MGREGQVDAVVFVLLDAFRHDYVGRTRFLQQIVPQSLCGQLEEPFGFCPRGAYFGGLTMAEQGFTNLFRFDPQRSAFRWTRHLGEPGPSRLLGEAREEVTAQARRTVPPFAAAYLDPLDIPLPWLGYFDVSERHAPWDPDAGYRSLFHVLDAASRGWLQVSWPFAGWQGRVTSGRVAGEALSRMTADHAFVFIHLPDLDRLGHLHGPGSREVQRALLETDRLCELIVARATELYRDPVVVFAGDHGMLPVVRTVDVAQALASTGLRWGHDFTYFIDSTMVRCWCFEERARVTALAALEQTSGGHLVAADDRERWGLAGIDPRSGEDIYLAHPGVLFSPSFFDWTGTASLRGMHGYAPDVPDNRAAFLAFRPRAARGGEAGVVSARQLFPSFLGWLGWNPAEFTTVPPVDAIAAMPPRWSAAGDARSDAVVEQHVARILQAVRGKVPDADAILMAGGFGRGEGSVTGCGPPRPVNDYDVVVVGGAPAVLADLGPVLAQELDIDFVDINSLPPRDEAGPVSQFDYDLRYGARLLDGDPLTLERLPRYAPADVDVAEGVLLIGNRAGGLLRALGRRERPEYLGRQGAKLLMAVADAWMMAQFDYHPSYRVRQDRFRSLSEAAGFSVGTRRTIDAAFDSKLRGAPLPIDGADALATAAAVALEELEHAAGWRGQVAALSGVLSRISGRRVTPPPAWFELLAGGGLVPMAASRPDVGVCLSAVYDACVAGVRAWPAGQAVRDQKVRAALSRAFLVATPDSSDASGLAAEAWFRLFH